MPPAAQQSRRPAWWLGGLFLAMLANGTDEFVIAGYCPTSARTSRSPPRRPAN